MDRLIEQKCRGLAYVSIKYLANSNDSTIIILMKVDASIRISVRLIHKKVTLISKEWILNVLPIELLFLWLASSSLALLQGKRGLAR